MEGFHGMGVKLHKRSKDDYVTKKTLDVKRDGNARRLHPKRSWIGCVNEGELRV